MPMPLARLPTAACSVAPLAIVTPDSTEVGDMMTCATARQPAPHPAQGSDCVCRVFDANGRLVAVSHHFGKNPYSGLDPLGLSPNMPLGEMPPRTITEHT